MARKTGAICAIVSAWLCLAGCSSLDVAGLLTFRSDTAGRDRVIGGSLEAVAQTTQSSLTQMGFAANVSRKGDTVRIVSKTATGARFTLVLSREKTKDGEQTRVHIEWEGDGDDQMGFQLLAQLEAAHQK